MIAGISLLLNGCARLTWPAYVRVLGAEPVTPVPLLSEQIDYVAMEAVKDSLWRIRPEHPLYEGPDYV